MQTNVTVEHNPNQVQGLVIVSLNRASVLNAMNFPTLQELAQVFKTLRNDKNVKVVILTGKGKAFSAGIDLSNAQNVFQDPKLFNSTKGRVGDDFHKNENDPVAQMEQCSFPIIGAINGFAVTGGFELALACDFLIASENAKFADTHAKFGLMPSWGLSQKLSRIVGIGKAKQISLTAQPIDAQEAEKLGIVNKVVQTNGNNQVLLDECIRVAKQILQNHPVLVKNYKKIIDDGYGMDYEQARVEERKRAAEYYKNMTPADFQMMKEFIAQRSAKQPQSKL